MRTKIINRLAAGTIGVCFAYALIRQPFAVMRNPDELMTSDRSAVTQTATQPATAYSVTTIPRELPEDTASEIYPSEKPDTESTETEDITEPIGQEEITEDKKTNENNTEEELQPQQNQSGGDVPTLAQFLSTMTCGGCRHNCPLVSPRCMKGRAKAESATVEYYETYGA